MDFTEEVLARLASAVSCGYEEGSPCAAEPAALAALALLAHRRDAAALRLLDWLIDQQNSSGCLGTESDPSISAWATGWAVIAWKTALHGSIANDRFSPAIGRALGWVLKLQGTIMNRNDWQGHDPTLVGWPWVEGTHSWVEPTIINLLALRHTGYGDHARAREARLLLADRLLPEGGCNYGNTAVLGQMLRPHLQPTGLCLTALAGAIETTPRIANSIEYLVRELSARTATASLCYGLIGLAAQKRFPAQAEHWLKAAAGRTLARERSGYKLALLALASLGEDCPLIARHDSPLPVAPTLEGSTP